MADANIVIKLGSSVSRGLGSLVSSVPSADIQRVFGIALNLAPGYPAPMTLAIPEVFLYTPAMPFALYQERYIETGAAAGGNTVGYSDSAYANLALSPAAQPDQWVVIWENTTGQGLFKKLAADSGTQLTLASGVTWGTAVAADGKLRFLSNSHTIFNRTFAPGDVNTGTEVINLTSNHNLTVGDPVRFTNSGGVGDSIFTFGAGTPIDTAATYYAIIASATTIKIATTYINAINGVAIDLFGQGVGTHTIWLAGGTHLVKNPGGTDVFTAADNGCFVLFPQGSAGNTHRRVIAWSAHMLTLDLAIDRTTAGPMIVLQGAPAAQSWATMTTGAVLLPLQLVTNTVPCLFSATAYSNYDLQPAGAAPSITTATINADPEMYTQFRARFGTAVYGLDLSRDSCTISPYPIGNILRPVFFSWQYDMIDFSFHPSSNDGLFEAISTMILDLKAKVEALGLTPKWRAVVIYCAENDQIPLTGGSERYKLIGENLARIRDAIRTLVGVPDLATVLCGPSSDYINGSVGYPYQEEVYAQIQEQVLLDTYTEYVDTTDDTRYQYVSDQLHLDGPSEFNLGVDIPLAYDRIVDGDSETDVDICNKALSHIGESAKVTALDGSDTSAQARHCVRFYLPALRHLLEMHSWDFATRRTELVEVTNTREEWTFAYEAPSKMAGAIAVLPPGASNDAPTQPFIKEIDPSGKTVIYTDVEDAVIRYNRYVTNTRKMSASFKRALSWLLASDLAGPIIKGAEGKKAAADCLALLREFLGQAKTHDANQQKVRPEIEAPWMPGGEGMVGPRDLWTPSG